MFLWPGVGCNTACNALELPPQCSSKHSCRAHRVGWKDPCHSPSLLQLPAHIAVAQLIMQLFNPLSRQCMEHILNDTDRCGFGPWTNLVSVAEHGSRTNPRHSDDWFTSFMCIGQHAQ